MADQDDVKRALAGLAREDAPRTPEPSDHDLTASRARRLADEAARAVEDLEAAADFRSSVGLDRLDRAVDALEDAGDAAAAARGRDALAAFRRFGEAARRDHFHRGRGTPLGRGDQAQAE